jgi:hypothetical protein
MAKERDWDQFHTPRNLTLVYRPRHDVFTALLLQALVGEVGELAEIFQWFLAGFVQI